MPTSVVGLLVDSGTTDGGSPISGVFTKSARRVDFEDVQYVRWSMGAEVTAPLGFGHWAQYHLKYSADSTDGVDGTWAALRTPMTLTGEDYAVVITAWAAIADPASATIWVRVEYTLSAAGVSSNCYFADLHFK